MLVVLYTATGRSIRYVTATATSVCLGIVIHVCEDTVEPSNQVPLNEGISTNWTLFPILLFLCTQFRLVAVSPVPLNTNQETSVPTKVVPLFLYQKAL